MAKIMHIILKLPLKLEHKHLPLETQIAEGSLSSINTSNGSHSQSKSNIKTLAQEDRNALIPC